MAKDEIVKKLEAMTMKEVLTLHREYSIKLNETFYHGTTNKLSELVDMLDAIEDYIEGKCR